jgi:DNA replication protein DnaC
MQLVRENDQEPDIVMLAWPGRDDEYAAIIDGRINAIKFIHEGRYARRLAAVAKYDLLVLDDWGLAPLNTEQCRDLLEIFEDRYDRRSTLVTSQIPVQDWHRLLTDPTIADAALDRILHNSHRIELRGESMRRSRSKTIQTELDSNNATQN